MEMRTINTTALAYIGDAVYELEIRKLLILRGQLKVDMLHKETVNYVSSDGQAKAVKEMMKEFLTEEEVKLVKRARNHKIASKPKNANPKKYKLATGLEALFGYLYLIENQIRLHECIDESVRIIEEDENEQSR